MGIIRTFKLVVVFLCPMQPAHRLAYELAAQFFAPPELRACRAQCSGFNERIQPHMPPRLGYLHRRGRNEAQAVLGQQQRIKLFRAQRRWAEYRLRTSCSRLRAHLGKIYVRKAAAIVEEIYEFT